MLVFANCLESLILWRCRARSRVSCTEQRRRRRLELSAAQSNNINMAGEALNWELQMSSVGEMSIKCIFVCLKVLSWGEVRGGGQKVVQQFAELCDLMKPFENTSLSQEHGVNKCNMCMSCTIWEIYCYIFTTCCKLWCLSYLSCVGCLCKLLLSDTLKFVAQPLFSLIISSDRSST